MDTQVQYHQITTSAKVVNSLRIKEIKCTRSSCLMPKSSLKYTQTPNLCCPQPKKSQYKKNALQQTVTFKQRVEKTDGISQTSSEQNCDMGSVGWAPFIGAGIAFAAVFTYIFSNTDDILDLLVKSIGEISLGCGVGMVGGPTLMNNESPECKKEPEECCINDKRRKWSLEEIDETQ